MKGNPVDLLNLLETDHVESVKVGEVVQVEDSSNVCNGVASEGVQIENILSDQVSEDLLWAIQNDGTTGIGGDSNASRDS